MGFHVKISTPHVARAQLPFVISTAAAVMGSFFFSSLTVPVDLSPEERSELEDIRRRKGVLLQEIQRLREELREAILEVEGLETSTEGRWGENAQCYTLNDIRVCFDHHCVQIHSSFPSTWSLVVIFITVHRDRSLLNTCFWFSTCHPHTATRRLLCLLRTNQRSTLTSICSHHLMHITLLRMQTSVVVLWLALKRFH